MKVGRNWVIRYRKLLTGEVAKEELPDRVLALKRCADLVHDGAEIL